MQSIKPLPKQVLVRPALKENAKTEGGIILPSENSPLPNQATVIAVGDGVNEAITPGIKIIHQKFQGEPIKLGEIDYIIMPELAILGIIEEVQENG